MNHEKKTQHKNGHIESCITRPTCEKNNKNHTTCTICVKQTM